MQDNPPVDDSLALLTELPAELVARGGAMGRALLAFDWASSPIGPIELWPASLKTAVGICLASRFPVLIWWGPELVKIYNDNYAPILGKKHPSAFGAAGRKVWPEIWATIGPLLANVMEHGEANLAEDLYLPLERNGFPEECYFTFSYSPIWGESGRVEGVFTPVVETTEKVIARRRLATLRDLAAARPKESLGTLEACAVAARVCSDNPYDLPCVWIYLFDELRRTGDSIAGVLAGRTSSDAHIEPLPKVIDLTDPATALRWSALHPLIEGKPCHLPYPVADFPHVPRTVWGDRVAEAVALPLCDLGSAEPLGFVIAAISPRQPLDDSYRTFLDEVANAIAISLRESRSHAREITLRNEAEAERQRIRSLFQQAPAAIAVLAGPEHRFTFVNALYVSLVQRSSYRELVGRTVREALPEFGVQPFFDWLDTVYRTGVPFTGTETLAQIRNPKTGELTDSWLNFVYQPTRDSNGQVDGVLLHCVDVSQQVLARQETEKSELRFRTLADTMPQMAWTADPQGNLTWCNRRWYQYTGMDENDPLGWGWERLHDPNVLPAVNAKYQHSLTTGEPFEMVFPLRGRNGEMRDFLTLASPMRDANGEIVRWFGTNTDVDTQRKTQDALRQSEKLAAVGRLASSIAHEINNPLEAVINLVYLARHTPDGSATKKYLAEAEHELDRVAQITNHTLRFHKQQSAAAAADIAEILQSVLGLFRGKLGRDGIQLRLEVKPTPQIVCFAGEIRQVLANLIGNALDAMPSGGELCIRLRPATDCRNGAASVRITVADTGHGMPPAVLKHIYEPFFTTRGATGTGLGLWVSSGIVDSHGGSFQVHSRQQPPSGTIFALTLPLEPPPITL